MATTEIKIKNSDGTWTSITGAAGGGSVTSLRMLNHGVKMISGRYYDGALAGSQVVSYGIAFGYTYAVPFYVSETTTFDRIGAYVNAPGTTTLARFGIYNSGTNGLPSTVLLDAGTIAAATSSVAINITISQILTGDTLYWLAVEVNGTSTSLLGRAVAQWSLGATSQNAVNTSSLYVAHTFGALPTPYGTGTYTDGAPSIRLRAV